MNNNGRKDDRGLNKAVQETKDKMKESWQNFDADQAKKDMEDAFDPKTQLGPAEGFQLLW